MSPGAAGLATGKTAEKGGSGLIQEAVAAYLEQHAPGGERVKRALALLLDFAIDLAGSGHFTYVGTYPLRSTPNIRLRISRLRETRSS